MIARSLRLPAALAAFAALAAGMGCTSMCGEALSDGAGARGAPPPQNAGSPSGDGTVDPASRAVEEADIVQLDGSRLYAMSRQSGLSIVDVSSDTRLTLMGKKALPGVPFEMYRRNDVVFAMSNEAIDRYGHETPPGLALPAPAPSPGLAPSPPSTANSAIVTALDVRDPRKVRSLASFHVPGQIADSRIVGDVLYVVSYENGDCFRCAGVPRTVVSTFDVSAPAQPRPVDHLAFTSDTPGDASWMRSVVSTAERMYVAGNDYAWSGTKGEGSQSQIQVLDVSDPTGKLRVGAKILVRGQIVSRWQMDEHEGVLRVISQRDIANTRNGSGMPFVDTYRIESSDAITPLGQGALVLPMQEALKAVRFDGARAYAITFRETDPLFTLDLSDPTLPVQKGELTMPGYVHHIEPRGDRLVALGIDRRDPAGNLNVSLFDVSDLSYPTMLSRVSFGAVYTNDAQLTEDQNRIHKAFRVLDEEGLVVVPFTPRYEPRYGTTTCTPGESGIQLVDWRSDTLVKRGVASIGGNPRRAIVDNGGTRLIAVSDTALKSFALVDRSAPRPTAELVTGTCTVSPQGDDFNEGYDMSEGWGGGGRGCGDLF